MIVFLDLDILLDVLLFRQPFSEAATSIWNMIEHREIEGHISAISFNNAYYKIMKNSAGKQNAEKAIRLLRDLFKVVPADEFLISDAIDAAFDDFEDAIQYVSAKRCRAEILVTRNPQHFPAGKIKVMTSDQFIKQESGN